MTRIRAIPDLTTFQPVLMTTDGQKPETRDEGVRCPACHCRHCPVRYTIHRGKYTIRVRACRHCGKEMRTREEVVFVKPED